MTVTQPSRTTLADVISLISLSDLTDRQKQDMRSAVRTAAKALGAIPEDIHADVVAIRRRLDALSPEALGLTRGRWANMRSLLGKAMALARPMLPGRSAAHLLPAWDALVSGLTENRRYRLLPLLRFLSEREIGPDRVGMADLECFRDAIFNDRLRGQPEKAWSGLLWAWNACQRERAGWPALVITRPKKREIYLLPWSVFPASLKKETDSYLDRLAGIDLSEDGPPRPARPATLKTRAYQLQVSASALVHRGVPAETIRSLADLVTLENYQSLLRFFLDRHDGKASPMAGQIAGFLKDVARHWVKADEDTIAKMKKIVSRLTPPRRGMTLKNRERLRPLDEPENVARFLGLSERIREDVEKDKRAPRLRAVRAQIAAAIALLQAAPIRCKNLASLDLNKHLIARGKRLYLVIAEQDVKNSEPIDFELPQQTVEILAWYIREHRPHLLMKNPSDALFPGEQGKPKTPATLSTQIASMVKRYAGMTFNTHLFRHAAGKIFLDARPGQYEVMRRVLGHRSITTTTSIYAGAETRSAGTHFASVIAERRRALEATLKVKPRTRSESNAKIAGGGK
jgi:integrase